MVVFIESGIKQLGEIEREGYLLSGGQYNVGASWPGGLRLELSTKCCEFKSHCVSGFFFH